MRMDGHFDVEWPIHPETIFCICIFGNKIGFFKFLDVIILNSVVMCLLSVNFFQIVSSQTFCLCHHHLFFALDLLNYYALHNIRKILKMEDNKVLIVLRSPIVFYKEVLVSGLNRLLLYLSFFPNGPVYLSVNFDC